MIKLNEELRSIFKTEAQPLYNIEHSPLFITGCMRSGTTLLADKLTWHPQILKIGTELNEIWDEYANVPILEGCDHMDEADASYEMARRMNIYFSKFIAESKTLKRQVVRLNDNIRRGKGRVFYDWEDLIPMNKSPHLINKLGLVGKLFPKSKMLIIIRNPFAHAASMKFFIKEEFRKTGKKFFVTNDELDCWHISDKEVSKTALKYPRDFNSIPLMWKRMNTRAINYALKYPNRVQLVSYEALVSIPEVEYGKIFDFLHLKNEHHKAEEQIVGKKLDFKNTSTKGSPLNKWKKQLTSQEIKEVSLQEELFLKEITQIKESLKLLEASSLEYTFPNLL